MWMNLIWFYGKPFPLFVSDMSQWMMNSWNTFPTPVHFKNILFTQIYNNLHSYILLLKIYYCYDVCWLVDWKYYMMDKWFKLDECLVYMIIKIYLEIFYCTCRSLNFVRWPVHILLMGIFKDNVLSVVNQYTCV